MAKSAKQTADASPATRTGAEDGDTSTIRKPRATRRMAREPAVEGHTADIAPSQALRPASKISQIIALLRRQQGATLAEMTGVTGWLPHTTRAALTGLRKKGHTIAKTKRGDVTCYQIAEEG